MTDQEIQEAALDIIEPLREAAARSDADPRAWGALYRIQEAIKGTPFPPTCVFYGAAVVALSYGLLPHRDYPHPL
jgi:hypothetical protein